MSLEDMQKRIEFRGSTYDDRTVRKKLDSFHKTLLESYQAENIIYNGQECRCLINPSRLTEQFDVKVISIDFDYGLDEGKTFYWPRTEKHWIVEMQQHTEEAYFRGTIKRCDFSLDIAGREYWVHFRGPDEETTDWRQTHNIYFNRLNYSAYIELEKNNETVDYFSRHNIVPLSFKYKQIDEQGEDTGIWIEETHRWRVVATDKYSYDNLMQVYLKENFDNDLEDYAEPSPELPEPSLEEVYIDGPREIDVYDEKIKYSIKNSSQGLFVVNSSKIKLNQLDDSSCEITVLTGKSTIFTIQYIVDGELLAMKEVKVRSF